jgi:uncharacterized protein (TIGR03118 family)
MKAQREIKGFVTAVAATIGLLACGGGGGGHMPPVGTVYTATSLVVDMATTPGYGSTNTRQIDPNLVNAWGLAFNPTGFAWVANNGTSTSTLYDGNGVPQSLVVSIPAGQSGSASPTGIVFNTTQGFMISQAGLSGASAFIFAGEGGTIAGWSPAVDRTHAVTVIDKGAGSTVYKGLAISAFGGANYIYATDFHNNRIDVYDASFNPAALPGSFTDPAMPAGYAPFGIQAIGGNIYVAYALQDSDAHDEVGGAGLGLIDAYDSGGNFIKRLVSPGGALNAPWGMAMAPANFGKFSGDLLVGNFGDGKINAFDPVTGNFQGPLGKAEGQPIVIDGLWAIAFGNGLNSQPTNTLFFTAGPGDEAHGAYGRIDVK